jgi:hypothetical protein
MWSRRDFLHLCAASSAGLAGEGLGRADDKPAEKKPESLLTPKAKAAIASGLKYLQKQQHKDGSFGTAAYRGNVGITSLCGLALLSGGHQPGAGAFGTVLDRALDFVLSQEDPRRKGYLHNPKASPHGPMYNHGFAVSFLATASGKVGDRKRAAKVDEVLRRAVKLTLASQNAEKGWRYTPDSHDSDVTATACQVCALRAARDAGVGVPRAALAGAAGYLKKCQDRSGGFHYMRVHGAAKPGWARTAAALLALYCAGVTRGQEVERGLAFLLKNRPNPQLRDVHSSFGHYHAALATWAAGGEARKTWYTASRDELIGRQGADGSWLDQICKHYGTATALIALQAPGGVLSPEF